MDTFRQKVHFIDILSPIFDFCKIKSSESLFNLVADAAELRLDEGWCASGVRRVIETDVQSFPDFPSEHGTGVAGSSAYGDDIVPLLADVGIDVGGYVTVEVDAHFFHDLYG